MNILMICVGGYFISIIGYVTAQKMGLLHKSDKFDTACHLIKKAKRLDKAINGSSDNSKFF